MKIILLRDIHGKLSTQGKLYVDGAFFGYTIEPANFNSEQKLSLKGCISAGKYKVNTSFSARFRRILPILVGVRGFEGIRIHAGNTARDTLGCICVGYSRVDYGIANSGLAVDNLIELMRKDVKARGVHEIEIFNDVRSLMQSNNENSGIVYHHLMKA